MFPLARFLIKIKFFKTTETEKDLFTSPLSSGLMALGKEKSQGHGALLTPLHSGHPGSCTSQAQGEQHFPGVVLPLPRGNKGAVVSPKTCFGLRSTFRCTFPPSTCLCTPLAQSWSQKDSALSSQKLQDSGMCRKLPWGG